MLTTIILALIMCLLLFLMIWSAAYFLPWKRLMDFFPADIREKAVDHQPPFRTAPIFGRVCMILCMLGFIGVIVYGGGFSSEISGMEKKASAEYGKRSGRDVWLPRYPNVMDDGITIRELYQMVLETYRSMLDSYKPENIAVIGFSAGATLGLGMFEYNSTLDEPLPVPALLIASSPACIPHTEAERKKVQALADQDIMIPASFVHSIKEAMCHGEELPGWMYEITTGDLSHMPYTHLYYGSDEVLRASAEALTAAFDAHGSKCELHIGQGLFHCYPAIRFVPECRIAFDEIVGYLRKQTAGSSVHMKKLNIDHKKHMGYSKSAERGIRARLRQKYDPDECERLMEQIDRQYEEFLVDLPYCGGKHNLMIWQLYDAIAAFAYYEALPEKETPEEFMKTCAVIFEKDRQRKPLPRFLTVDSKGFLKLAGAAIRPIARKMNRELDSGNWQDGWRIEQETDHLNEGLQVALVGCPIYNFAVKYGYETLMPAMCNCDFPGIDFLHAGLVRPRTVSNGDDRCDNWFVSMDSDAVKRYPPVMRENGLLVSKDWRQTGRNDS